MFGKKNTHFGDSRELLFRDNNNIIAVAFRVKLLNNRVVYIYYNHNSVMRAERSNC